MVSGNPILLTFMLTSVMHIDQDTQLDALSLSIGRQRDLSLQINDEVGVHHTLLEELDTEVDHTRNRLGRARNQLGRFAKGAKENGAFVIVLYPVLPLKELCCRLDGDDCCAHICSAHSHYRIQNMIMTTSSLLSATAFRSIPVYFLPTFNVVLPRIIN